ncbi:MAG: OB-fold domain-containing protein [Halioglobus sp.]|nr:OB-fold domain-containing protein [Halioglobus sp.]
MDKPHPVVTPLTQPYWDAVAQGRLALQRCVSCRHWIHFPEPRCPRCGGHELQFEAVAGVGVVESFSVIHRSFVPGYGPGPYVIAWVALPEQPGLRVMTNIVDSDPQAVTIGAAVSLCFEQRGDFGEIPQFTLTSNQSWE